MTKQNSFNYIWPTLFGSFYNPEHQKIKNQLISFFDIGSSWSGKSPFNTDNSINIWVINDPGSVFDAEVVNSKNPWLSSFGWGIQSLIMDYYVKIDFAKPIEDYKVGKPKLHFSIGYSF